MRKLGLILTVLSIIIFSGITNAQNNEEIKIQTSAQCQMCKDRIEKALSYEKGIVSSNLDLTTKIVAVVYKPLKTNPDKIRIALTKVGYKADEFKADPIAYENLPACCKVPEDNKSDHKNCTH